MRDFFWFAVLSFAMYAVGDYYTTMKTVSVAERHESAEAREAVAAKAEAEAFLLADKAWR